MEKYKKEELEKMILVENLSYKKIGEIYGISGVYARKLCLKFGIEIPERAKRTKRGEGIYIKREFFCKNCGKEILKKSQNPKFCDFECNSEFIKENSIKNWLENQEEYRNRLINFKSWVKPYLLSEQEHKCKICGIDDVWNGNKMVFVLDHIDGNASNNTKENLRLICHNCDSQLPTYKSKNKKSARINRYSKNNGLA